MRAFIPAAFLCLAACASGNTSPSAGTASDQPVRVVGTSGTALQATTTVVDEVRVGTVPRARALVWADLPGVYQSLGIEVSERDANAGTLGNSSFRVRRRLGSVALARYIDCGRTQDGPNADTYEVFLSVLTQVKEDDKGGTVVTTAVRATARPINFVANEVNCTSTGALEERLFRALLSS